MPSSTRYSRNTPPTTGAGAPPQVFQYRPPSFDPNAKLFGIPRYQPFIGGRSFNYEQKYPPDPMGGEARDDARVWSTYLDEAESHDYDMIQGFRDTIDSLLVLAGLFSAIVATFVAQTTQSLKPDVAQLNLLIQIEQTALLRAGGNASALNLIPSSRITTDTPTYTKADLWINGLFLTSLSLSMATALLAVLVKQWCQAYTSVTSGSLKDKCLIRQFRFDGLIKWKLPEIVGSLPLLLHLAFGVFLAGLSYFVYDLNKTLSSIIIITFILAAVAYFGTLLLPAIWLECPYRISLLFRPARFLVHSYFSLLRMIVPNLRLTSALSRYLPHGEWKRTEVIASLKHAEQIYLNISGLLQRSTLGPSHAMIARSFAWLFDLSLNKSTRRIVSEALHGYLSDGWALPPSHLLRFFNMIPFSSIAETALENIFLPGDENRPRVFIALLDRLFNDHWFLKTRFASAPPPPLSQASLDLALLSYAELPAVLPEVGKSLIHWGADANFDNQYGHPYSPLFMAITHNSLQKLQFLVAANADVNLVTDGRTLLMWACVDCHIDIAKYLVQHGADANIVCHSVYESSTVLTYTLSNLETFDFEFIGYLIDHGAYVDTRLDGLNDTALYRVVRAGEVEAVRFLLEKGATVHAVLAQPDKIEWRESISESQRCEIETLLRKHSDIDSRTGTRRGTQCLSYIHLPPVLSRTHLA
ncbi:hypothetical protein DL96DRAFT_1504329 [Flagelloscypha sp. PMI_526]|nr:hypothetical protein DL96DRAFT_1504329 [Flagelloscypha sp. PMI_526]